MYIKILKNSLGIVLVVIGVIGIFTPILPGILLIIGGLFLMGIKLEKVKEWWKKVKF